MHTTKPPAVAGQFYPGKAAELKSMVDQLLTATQPADVVPRAIIAPHAGYIYSGKVAASAYAVLQSVADKIKRVVLLGPAHYYRLDRLAVPSQDYFATPLGEVKLDRGIIAELCHFPQVQQIDAAFTKEHSLEVQLPFLQEILPDFSLVPILVGKTHPYFIAEIIEKFWYCSETLIVISSDLSHYHDYATAKKIDAKTIADIVSQSKEGLEYGQACGRNPINGLLYFAKKHRLHITAVDHCNSGDTAGPRNRVVGYGAFHVFSDEQVTTYSDEQQKIMLSLARDSIKHGLQWNKPLVIALEKMDARLQEMRASFVSLHIAGRLRGCVGSLQAVRPLAQDIVINAFNAAFKDPRFPPLQAKEFDKIELSISVLSLPEPMTCHSNEALLKQLRPGVDGLIVEDQGKRSTFLPVVWENLATPEQFVQRLKQKAGFPADYWSDTIRWWRYTAESIK